MVAQGAAGRTEALWPYQVATILNYSVQNDSENVLSDLKTWNSWNTLNTSGLDFFGPINQLILENKHCINFTGFSLSTARPLHGTVGFVV
jgi:hypothetical protein